MKNRIISIISLCFIAIFACLLTFPTPHVYAAASGLPSSTLDFFNQNNILYYDPSGLSGCASGSVNLAGNNPEEKIWSGLISLGYTPVQTAAILGNMFAESGYNPARIQTSCSLTYEEATTDATAGKCGYGLIQWTGGRRINMLNSLGDLTSYFSSGSWNTIGADAFMTQDPSGFDALTAAELLYLQQELTNIGAYHFFVAHTADETDPRAAADIFRKRVEGTDEAADKRMAKAEEVYNKYKDAVITGGSSSSNCAGGNDFQGYVLRYAWPQYHAPVYTQLKPDYASVVQSRISRGEYVGSKGVDCGGFVTTLMQESGFATDYNSGKGNTDTQEQWAASHWQLLNDTKTTPIDSSKLQPGDVAFTSGHTFVYVGNISGFSSTIASASYNERAPMAGKENLIKNGSEVVRWYRKR